MKIEMEKPADIRLRRITMAATASVMQDMNSNDEKLTSVVAKAVATAVLQEREAFAAEMKIIEHWQSLQLTMMPNIIGQRITLSDGKLVAQPITAEEFYAKGGNHGR